MKKIVYALLLLAISGSLSAQIPNNLFESWINVGAYDSLQFWSTPNFIAPTSASKEQIDIQSGAISLKLTTSSYLGASVPGAASTGGFIQNGLSIDLSKGGQPDNVRHTTLNGYYKYNAIGGATGTIEVVLFKRNGSVRDTVASGIQVINNTPNYTAFSIPLVYKSFNAPDSSIVYFQSSGRATSDLFNGATIGSSLYIDSVYFQGITTGINNISADPFSVRAYPNPAREFVTVETTRKISAKTSISILDIHGKVVETIPMTDEKQRIDISALSSGNYFYNLVDEKNKILGSGKFSVSK